MPLFLRDRLTERNTYRNNSLVADQYRGRRFVAGVRPEAEKTFPGLDILFAFDRYGLNGVTETPTYLTAAKEVILRLAAAV